MTLLSATRLLFLMTFRFASVPLLRSDLARVLLGVFVLAGCTSGEGGTEPTGEPVEQGYASTSDLPDAFPGDSVGEMLYVPVYSHIYHGDSPREFDLAVTLSIRNTDHEHAVTVASVRYFDSEGTLVRRYLDAPLRLEPLASKSFVVAEGDRTGGVGASFLVMWRGGPEASPPVVEGVMISTASTQGISFVSRGVVVRRVGVGVADGGVWRDTSSSVPEQR